MKIENMKPISLQPDEFSLWLRATALNQIGENSITSPWHSKIDIYPHQIETVIKAISEDKPNLILADEVGLGKTIEAGMIIKEMLKRKKINSFLIIPPANLVSQWHEEMSNKFDIQCEIITRSNIKDILQNEIYGGYIISADYAKNNKEDISDVDWGLLIFDEAHHIRRHFSKDGNNRKTKKYELAECLKSKTESALFLTATPFQLNDFEFYSLLELINKDMFDNYDHFKSYREIYLPSINEAIRNLSRGKDYRYESKLLINRLYTNYPSMFKEKIEPKDANLINILEQSNIIKKYVIRHKRRIEFANSPPREVNTVKIKYTNEELNIYKEISSYTKNQYNKYIKVGKRGNGFVMVIFQQLLTSSPKALLKTMETRVVNLKEKNDMMVINNSMEDTEENEENAVESFYSGESLEEEINTLTNFISKIKNIKKDSKLEMLINMISNILVNNPKEKIIIFTRFLETQKYIEEILSEHFKTAIFNGKLGPDEKNEQIEKFKKYHQILISTESGGEGRNFQFCHVMINYDMPWNPVKLEQRIGRIDRIGQTKTVIVNNLSTFDTIEQRILDVLSSRISDFEDLIGPMDAIIGSTDGNIIKLLMKQEELTEVDVKLFEITLEDKIKKASIAKNKFEELAIFERANRDKTELMKQEINRIDESQILRFIIQSINKKEGAHIKSVGDNIFEINIPSGFGGITSSKTITGTPFKNVAMKNNAIEFLTSEHWLVIEMINDLCKYDGIIVSGDISREGSPFVDMVFSVENEKKKRSIGIRFPNKKDIELINNYNVFSETNKSSDNQIHNKINQNLNIFNPLIEKSIMHINKILEFDVNKITLVGIYMSNFDRWLK
ncbi:MAG: DEAD/DEAH box helicase family protein [Nanoarchaeota archaeon]|nr:DEAD/DEAH box helicase family protein [Nanoarchaeota archaeon]